MLEHAGCRNDRCSSMQDAGTIDDRACRMSRPTD